ncbi:MAG: serine/threonine-protein kinase [Bacillota bacterium]
MTHLERGTVLEGRYEILQVIDRGGTAMVYLGRRLGLDSRALVAVKELDPDAVKYDEYRNEVEALYNLSHPNLPKIYDFFEAEGRFYLVMEYVEGEALDLRTARTRPSEAEILDWAAQIADVMAYLHDQDPPLVHRDLKPANLLVDVKGRVKLVDFGIAARVSLRRSGKVIHGYTENMAAPEQVAGRLVDQRSDIFSFGATLYYMFTGEAPPRDYASPDKRETVRLDKMQIPFEVDQLIKKCLQLNPDNRYQSFHEVRERLADLRGYPAAPSPVRLARPRSSKAKPRVIAGRGIAMVVMFVIVLAWNAYAVRSVTGPTSVVYGETVELSVDINDPDLIWKVYDLQDPQRVRQDYRGTSGGKSLRFSPPSVGSFRVEVYRNDRLVARLKRIDAVQSFQARPQSVIHHRAILRPLQSLGDASKSGQWRWLIQKPDGTVVIVPGEPEIAAYQFDAIGAHVITLETTVKQGDAKPVVVKSPSVTVEIVNQFVPEPKRVVNLNPGFEQRSDGMPLAWFLVGNPSHYVHDVVKSGSAAMRIGPETGAGYVWSRWVGRPGACYRLTVWVKGEAASPGSLQVINIRFRSKTSEAYILPEVSTEESWEGSWDWRQMALEFSVPEGVDPMIEIVLNRLGDGTIWFDDCIVERLK